MAGRSHASVMAGTGNELAHKIIGWIQMVSAIGRETGVLRAFGTSFPIHPCYQASVKE